MRVTVVAAQRACHPILESDLKFGMVRRVPLQLTSDQAFFRETTAKFLHDQAPASELRRLRDDPAGFEEKYWRQGADLGWTSLLVDEAHGGGTISGDAVADVTLIA